MRKENGITISWILLILWLFIIFWFSSMPSNESNSKSKETINKVIEATVETTNKVGLTDKHPSPRKMNEVIELLNKPLRKCVHASEYFILLLLVINLFKRYGMNNWKMYIYGIIFCILYACTDEFHQLFVDGRTGQFSDVLIDTTGSVIGCLIFLLINKFKVLKRKNIIKSI